MSVKKKTIVHSVAKLLVGYIVGEQVLHREIPMHTNGKSHEILRAFSHDLHVVDPTQLHDEACYWPTCILHSVGDSAEHLGLP